MRIDSADLEALATEAEAGTGADRELDTKIARLVGTATEYVFAASTLGHRHVTYSGPEYTTSRDAVAMLTEVRLPEYETSVDFDFDTKGWLASLYHEGACLKWAQGRAKTEPRARLAAALRALAKDGKPLRAPAAGEESR